MGCAFQIYDSSTGGRGLHLKREKSRNADVEVSKFITLPKRLAKNPLHRTPFFSGALCSIPYAIGVSVFMFLEHIKIKKNKSNYICCRDIWKVYFHLLSTW